MAANPDVFSLVESLGAEDDEAAVVTAVTRRVGDARQLIRASLVIGPKAITDGNWQHWQSLHQLPIRSVKEHDGASYSVTNGDFATHRVPITVQEAAIWLSEFGSEHGSSGLASLPPLERAELAAPAAPLRISRHLDTTASTFVHASVRSGIGFLLRGHSPLPDLGDSGTWWRDGDDRYINAPLLAGVPLLPSGCAGIVAIRLERRAWFNALRGGPDLETFECHLGLEPERIDVSDLVVSCEEWIDDELVLSQLIPLEDLAVDHVRGAPNITLQLPTLGTQVQRTLHLRDRAGSLLDSSSTRFRIAESIAISVNPIGLPAPAVETVIGERRLTPSYVERADAVDRVRAQYEDLFAAGASVTLLPAGTDVRAVLTGRLAQARGRLRIVDRYFGKSQDDWVMLGNVAAPIEVLTSLGSAPAQPLQGLTVRWHRGGRPPFHGRAYLWDGGGFSVDASPDAFGRDLVYIRALPTPVSDAWHTAFTAWWASAAKSP